MSKNTFNLDLVIDLGGSLLYSDGELDVLFLKRMAQFIREESAGKRIAIVVGGGKVCRDYQESARRLLVPVRRAKKAGSQEKEFARELDLIGVAATKLNAELFRAVLGDIAYPKVLESPHEPIEEYERSESAAQAGYERSESAAQAGFDRHRVFFFSGWKPGWSTDFVAVLIAKRFGIKKVISLSNIKGVYPVENGKLKRGKTLERLGWDEYERFVGSEWIPGMKIPFDPIATNEAKREHMEVVVMSGRDLGNIRNFLDGKPFTGTVIH